MISESKEICSNCVGCGACINKCPFDAIEFELNDRFEEIAKIDTKKCKNCALCKKICPQINETSFFKSQKVYAAWTKDIKEYESTSSGGLATLISKWFIENNGIVYGASFEKDEVKHIRVTELLDLEHLKGSKYVQSFFSDVFRYILRDLSNNKRVLIVGTPCQIAAIRSFVPENLANNLFLIDLVCHGVPPKEMFKSYLNELLKKNIIKNLSVSFRNKQTLFAELLLLLDKITGKIVYRCKWQKDYYFRAFMMNLTFRESCYSCKYAREERVGDITLCDFWGIKKIDSGFSIPKNISGVMINSEKGEYIFNEVADKCYFVERSLNELVDGNQNLRRPSNRNSERTVFLREFKKNHDFISSVKKTSIRKHILIDTIIEKIKIPYRLFKYRKTGLIDIDKINEYLENNSD